MPKTLAAKDVMREVAMSDLILKAAQWPVKQITSGELPRHRGDVHIQTCTDGVVHRSATAHVCVQPHPQGNTEASRVQEPVEMQLGTLSMQAVLPMISSSVALHVRLDGANRP